MLVGLIGSWWFFHQAARLSGYFTGVVFHWRTRQSRLNKDHIVSLIAIAGVLFGQLYWDSMPLGALLGILITIIGGAVELRNSDGTIAEGNPVDGYGFFYHADCGGYAYVVNQTGAVDTLIDATLAILGASKVVFVIVLIIIGLLITMVSELPFGTIPVIALFYVPMCMKMNMSVRPQPALSPVPLLLGDAGSPASDSTAWAHIGLNADGQHDHIQDSCVPTFFFYNLPLAIAGFIGGDDSLNMPKTGGDSRALQRCTVTAAGYSNFFHT